MRAKYDRTYEKGVQAARAEAELEREGLSIAPKPRYEAPTLPTRIADLDDDTLMDLFVRLTRWTDHLNGQLALASVEEREAEAVLGIAEATALVGNYSGKEDSVNVAKAHRDLDPKVVEASDEVQYRYARRKLLEAMFSSAERDSAAVSRELTRRVGRMEVNERRTGKWRP